MPNTSIRPAATAEQVTVGAVARLDRGDASSRPPGGLHRPGGAARSHQTGATMRTISGATLEQPIVADAGFAGRLLDWPPRLSAPP